MYFITLETTEGEWVEPDVQDKITGNTKLKSVKVNVLYIYAALVKPGKYRYGYLQVNWRWNQMWRKSRKSRPLIAVGLVDLRAFHNYGDGYDGGLYCNKYRTVA